MGRASAKQEEWEITGAALLPRGGPPNENVFPRFPPRITFLFLVPPRRIAFSIQARYFIEVP
jgi:hypothetical protein